MKFHLKMPGGVRRLALKTLSEFSDDRCSAMAATLAYYALFAMPALLLAAMYVAGALYGRQSAEGRLRTQLTSLLGAQTASAVQMMIAGAGKGHRAGAFANLAAFGGLVFSAFAAVYELQQSLNRAWDVRVEKFAWRRFVAKRTLSVIVIVGSTILLIVSLAAAPALTAIRGELSDVGNGVLYGIELVFSWALFTALLAVIMKVLPDAEIEWRDVSFGAAMTSLLIVIGRFLIGMYLAHAGFASIYGAAGSIAVLLIWGYYSAAILLLGVEFTQVWARENGRRIQPEAGAVRIATTETAMAPNELRG